MSLFLLTELLPFVNERSELEALRRQQEERSEAEKFLWEKVRKFEKKVEHLSVDIRNKNLKFLELKNSLTSVKFI